MYTSAWLIFTYISGGFQHLYWVLSLCFHLSVMNYIWRKRFLFRSMHGKVGDVKHFHLNELTAKWARREAVWGPTKAFPVETTGRCTYVPKVLVYWWREEVLRVLTAALPEATRWNIAIANPAPSMWGMLQNDEGLKHDQGNSFFAPELCDSLPPFCLLRSYCSAAFLGRDPTSRRERIIFPISDYSCMKYSRKSVVIVTHTTTLHWGNVNYGTSK